MSKRYIFLLLFVILIPLTYGENVENVLSLTNFKIMGLPSIEIIDEKTNAILQSSSSSFPPYLCFSTDCPQDIIHIYEEGNAIDVKLSDYIYRVGVYCLPYTLFYPTHISGITQPAKKISFECDGKKDDIWYYVNINPNKEFSLHIPKQFLSNYNKTGKVIISNTTYLSIPSGKNFYFIISSKDANTQDVIPSSTVNLQVDEYEAYMLNPIDINPTINELSDLSGHNISFTLPSQNMYMKSLYLSFIGKRTDDCLLSPSSCWGAYYHTIPLPIIFNTTIIGLEDGEEAALNSTFHVLFNYTVLDKNAGEIKSVKVMLYGKNASGKDIGISLNSRLKPLYISPDYKGEYSLLTLVEHTNGNTYIYNYTFYVAPYYIVLNFTSSEYYAGDEVDVEVSLENSNKEKLSVDSVELELIDENGSVVDILPYSSAHLLPDGEYHFSFTLPQDRGGRYYIKDIVSREGRKIMKEESINVKDMVNNYYFDLKDSKGNEIEKININPTVNHALISHVYLHNLGKPFFLSFLNVDIDKKGLNYNVSEYQGDGDKNLVDRNEIYDIEIKIDPYTLLTEYGPVGEIGLSASVGDFKRDITIYYIIDLNDKFTLSFSSPIVVLNEAGRGRLCMTLHNGMNNVTYKGVKIMLTGPLAKYFSQVEEDVGTLKGGERKNICFQAYASSTINDALTISLYINEQFYKNLTQEVRLDKEMRRLIGHFDDIYSRFKSYCDNLNNLPNIENISYSDLEERCSLIKQEAEESREKMDKEEMNNSVGKMEAIMDEIDSFTRSSDNESLTLEEVEAELKQACDDKEISEDACSSITSEIEILKANGVYSQEDLLDIKQRIEKAMEENKEQGSEEGSNGLLMAFLFLAILLVIGGVIFFTSLVPDEDEQTQEEEEF